MNMFLFLRHKKLFSLIVLESFAFGRFGGAQFLMYVTDTDHFYTVPHVCQFYSW